MTDKIEQLVTEWWPMFLLALAAASGAGGGCTVSIMRTMKDNTKFSFAMIAAYAFIGMINTIIAFGFVGYLVGYDTMVTLRLVGVSFLWGAISTGALAAQNMTSRWSIKIFGNDVIELTRQNRRSDDEPKK